MAVKKEEQKSLLMYSLVIPGLIIIGSAIFLFNRDYSILVSAENNLSRIVNNQSRRSRTGQRRLDFIYHRTSVQRINVLADQAWGLIGGLITAIGIHGIVTNDLADSKSSAGSRDSSGGSRDSLGGSRDSRDDRR